MQGESDHVTPTQAFDHATQCIREGRWDGRSAEGAKINALESIAWSLVGLLGQRVQRGHEGHASADAPDEPISEFLEKSGFVTLTTKAKKPN